MAGIKSVIALAFVFTVLLEPTLDRHCHAQTDVAQSPSRHAESGSGDDDPCGSTCVPDCYCCSTPAVTVLHFDPPSAPISEMPEALPVKPLDGVTVVPDLPPIA